MHLTPPADQRGNNKLMSRASTLRPQLALFDVTVCKSIIYN